MPKQPFWFFLTWISILWYAYLVFHVGWKGFHDIRRMIRGLGIGPKGLRRLYSDRKRSGRPSSLRAWTRFARVGVTTLLTSTILSLVLFSDRRKL